MNVTRRKEDTTIDIVNVVLGGVLFLAPWIFGFAAEKPAALNAWIAGLLIAGVALTTFFAFDLWEEWLNVAIGAWAAISPWVLGFAGSAYAMWSHVVIGVLVALLAGIELWRQYDRPQTAS